jgi:hypothetical protein
MAPEDLSRFLDNFDRGRRKFLRQILAGAAFAPPVIASFSVAGPSITPAEAIPVACAYTSPTVVAFFDFSGTQYQDNFDGILRPGDITPGTDLAHPPGVGHTSLNFQGHVGSGGGTWLTVLDSSTPLPEDGCLLSLTVDILFHTFDNVKGAGLVALFNEEVGKQGVAVLLSDAGNTDKFQIVTVDQAGKLTLLKNLPIGSSIAENVWYRLRMDITNTSISPVTITGQVFRHTTPTDPDSDPETVPIATLEVSGPLPSGVDEAGAVGLMARAVNTSVNVSVTNFTAIESPTL